jgi:hypothetical protein
LDDVATAFEQQILSNGEAKKNLTVCFLNRKPQKIKVLETG